MMLWIQIEKMVTQTGLTQILILVLITMAKRWQSFMDICGWTVELV